MCICHCYNYIAQVPAPSCPFILALHLHCNSSWSRSADQIWNRVKVFNFIQHISVNEWVMLQGKKKSRCRGGQELFGSVLAPEKVFIWEYPESLIDLPLVFSKFKFLRLQFHFTNPFTSECKGFLFLSLPSLPTSVSCLFLPPARHHSPLVIPVKLSV